MITLVNNANRNKSRAAIISFEQEFTFADLLEHSANIAAHLLAGKPDLNEERIAFSIKPSFEYVAALWGIWRAGGIAVPLALNMPSESQAYFLTNAGCDMIVVEPDSLPLFESLAKRLHIRVVETAKLFVPRKASLPDIKMSRNALMLYTSGTTSKPKGVVTTHNNIDFQSKSLSVAWGWQNSDHVLNVLPLNHVHGLIVILNTALWTGAICEFIGPFDPSKIFEKFTHGKITTFMAVPTIYYKLIQHFDQLGNNKQKAIRNSLESFRLMASGSAALPVSVLEKWKVVSAHVLLERYGMTEIGIALANPYIGERKPGFVGLPIEGVDVRLANENDEEVLEGSGEIQVKGPNVFREYWNNPTATKESFTKDGWFRTGDIARTSDGYYKILGRNSVDIIKTGGHKVSALEIEEVIRTYEGVKDCSAIGLPDPEWGEVVAIGLIVNSSCDIEQLKIWAKKRLPGFMVPRKYIIVPDFPRNAMGKVTKKKMIALFK